MRITHAGWAEAPGPRRNRRRHHGPARRGRRSPNEASSSRESLIEANDSGGRRSPAAIPSLTEASGSVSALGPRAAGDLISRPVAGRKQERAAYGAVPTPRIAGTDPARRMALR